MVGAVTFPVSLLPPLFTYTQWLIRTSLLVRRTRARVDLRPLFGLNPQHHYRLERWLV